MTIIEQIRSTIPGNPLYHLFNNDKVATILKDCSLEKTIVRGTPSDKSLQIKCDDKDSPDDLVQIFNLNASVFPEKYASAISKFERDRIRILHSSSLAPLLCFYNITPSNPLKIQIEGREVVFNKSSYEEKNPIPHSSQPSNIDIVLRGHDCDNTPVILYLESKFSEYFKPGNEEKLSIRVYGDIYKSIKSRLESMGIEYIEYSDNYARLKNIEPDAEHYLGGVKQMVSHFLGLKSVVSQLNSKKEVVYLAEILFRFDIDDIDPGHKKFNDYANQYRMLAAELNKQTDDQFKLLDEVLTYQDFLSSYKLDSFVADYYSL